LRITSALNPSWRVFAGLSCLCAVLPTGRCNRLLTAFNDTAFAAFSALELASFDEACISRSTSLEALGEYLRGMVSSIRLNTVCLRVYDKKDGCNYSMGFLG